MDYEKEYKEALERAKAGKPMNEVFPELKENEDERITAEIVDFISRNAERGDDIMKSEGWIAYLERQKEQKPAEKISVSEELYEHIRNACACIEDAMSSDTLCDMTDYLEMADSSAQKAFDMVEKSVIKQPAEWSEEDELMTKAIIGILGEDDHPKLCSWLKSIRPQHQRRDTYYDIIHNILDTLKDMDFMKITPEHRISLLNDIRVKCKNADECAAILDEPHWKPSEEQIVALRLSAEEAFDDAGDCNRYRRLKSLYEDLKNHFSL